MLIFEPGRTTGMDIHETTSAIDVLPTLAHVTGESTPGWTEGVILPPFAPAEDLSDRSIYSLRAVLNGKYAPFTVGSFMQVRGGYKLHYYFGYPQTPGDGLVKLYDLQSDPEEMNDLAATKPETAAELLHDLQIKLKQVNEPYL
jgi:arylsulfatase A-like enzyme